jgi:NADH dehydrogenase
MNICVLGGGGFVGHHLASLLAARGHAVTVPCRQRERIKDLLVLPDARLVEADIHDPDTLRRLFAGMDAVINLVGILHGSEADFRRAHAELPSKVVEACRAAGVRRLLHMSALGADPASPSLYQRSKAEGEDEVLKAGDLDVTVFRPSVIFGPGDSFLSLFAGMLRLAPVVPLAGAHARFQPVYVLDVARAFADSLTAPDTIGKSYALCGPRVYTLAKLLAITGTAIGRTPLILPLGDRASYWFARLMELKPGSKLMTRDNYYAMRVDNVCPEGFPACFGRPTDLDAVIGYLRAAGQRAQYARHRRAARR